MSDLISREDVLHELDWCDYELKDWQKWKLKMMVRDIPSAKQELPLYVAEIEEEYQKAVKSPYIHKPLAKALYEVWKKYDREDVSEQ